MNGAWLLLTPYLVGLVVLVLLPAVAAIGLSFFDYDVVRSPRFVGAGNYQQLVSDQVFRIAVRNTLTFIAIAVPIRMVIVLGLALLLHPPMRRGQAYRAAIFLPVLIPEIAYALAWLWIFNPLHGPLNAAIGSVGLSPVAWLTDPVPAQAALVIMSLFTVGEAFIVMLVARRLVPVSQYEQAAIEGASAWATLRFVTLPALWPILAVLAGRDALLALQSTFVPALIVTNGGPPPYATTHTNLFVYREAFEFLRYGYAAAATVVVLLIAGLITVAQLRMLSRLRGLT